MKILDLTTEFTVGTRRGRLVFFSSKERKRSLKVEKLVIALQSENEKILQVFLP